MKESETEKETAQMAAIVGSGGEEFSIRYEVVCYAKSRRVG